MYSTQNLIFMRLKMALIQRLIVFFFLLSLCMKAMVEATTGYILEIRAHTYQNSGHGDSKGVCCESLLSTPACVLECDNIFVFCLRNAGTARDDNPLNCPLGSFNTTVDIPGGDDITFGPDNITTGVPNPMTFTGNVWPGQVQLYIEVVDRDMDDPNDHVDDIYTDISMSPSASFSPVISYNGDHENGRIGLSFRVRCETYFFGENCTTFCRPNNNSTGRFTCGLNGEKICLQGYSGVHCDQPANTVNESNMAAIVGGGVGAGVGIVMVLLIIIITITVCVSTKGRKRNKKTPPPDTSFNFAHGTDFCNTSPNEAYDHNMLSGGTQPNIAYRAGSTWLQGANTDEGTGTYSYIDEP